MSGKINDLINNMTYKQRRETLHLLRAENTEAQKEYYLGEMQKRESFIGKTYKSKDAETYYRFISARSSRSNYMEALVFSLPVSIQEKTRATMMLFADSAFSTIDFEGPEIQSVPVFDNGKLWFWTHEEVEERVYFEKLSEYFQGVEEAVKTGVFNTSKAFLEREFGKNQDESSFLSEQEEVKGNILDSFSCIAEFLATLTLVEKEELREKLGECTEKGGVDVAVRDIRSHQDMIGKCFQKDGSYFYLVSSRSTNQYWMEALTFSLPIEVKEEVKMSLIDSGSSVFAHLECDTLHVTSVPIYTSLGRWVQNHEEISQEEFFEKLAEYSNTMIQQIKDGTFDKYI